MFAVIENGSHQHIVHKGDTLSIDYQSGSEAGGTITFDRVLLANGGGASAVGTPVIEGATVDAEVVLPEEKGPKLEIQKIRRRKNSRRHTGHRQKYTQVKITAINVPGLEVVDTPPDDGDASPSFAAGSDSGTSDDAPTDATSDSASDAAADSGTGGDE